MGGTFYGAAATDRPHNGGGPRTRNEHLPSTGPCCTTNNLWSLLYATFPAAVRFGPSPSFCVNESRFSSAASPHIAVHVAAAFRIGLHIRQIVRTDSKWRNSAGLTGAAGKNRTYDPALTKGVLYP